MEAVAYLFHKIEVCKAELDNFYLSIVPEMEKMATRTPKKHFELRRQNNCQIENIERWFDVTFQ